MGQCQGFSGVCSGLCNLVGGASSSSSPHVKLEGRPRAPSASVLPRDLSTHLEDEDLHLTKFVGSDEERTAFVFVGTCRGRPCSAKVYDLEKIDRTRERDELDREVNVLEKLGAHPHIVQYIADFRDGGRYRFAVMEFVGGSLHEQVFCYGRLTHFEARHIFRQMLMAVGHIHSHRMMHRDLKLKSCLIAVEAPGPPQRGLEDEESGRTYQLKVTDCSSCGTYPKANSRVGSALFVAPEVAAHDSSQPYDYAVDFWSLGIILFCSLCGHYPIDDPAGLGSNRRDVLSAGRFSAAHANSPWSMLQPAVQRLISGLLTVEWDCWYGQRARYGLGRCLESSWLDPKLPPEWPPGEMAEPPRHKARNEISLQKVLVSRDEVGGCVIGGMEDAKKAMLHKDKCLNIWPRFKMQVLHITRIARGAESTLECEARPGPGTILQRGDWVYYACRRSLDPSGGHARPRGGSLGGNNQVQYGDMEQLLTNSERYAKTALMDCCSFEVPEAWNNCVLGGEAETSKGQGFLNFRNNFAHLTVAAIVPSSESTRQTVLFPGGQDVVRTGDRMYFPRKYKDADDSDTSPFTGQDREVMQELVKRAKKALSSKPFKDKAHFERLCQEGKARRAV